MANGLFIRKQLNDIFMFRRRRVEELFGMWIGKAH
jgi:hypothetical protein